MAGFLHYPIYTTLVPGHRGHDPWAIGYFVTGLLTAMTSLPSIQTPQPIRRRFRLAGVANRGLTLALVLGLSVGLAPRADAAPPEMKGTAWDVAKQAGAVWLRKLEPVPEGAFGKYTYTLGQGKEAMTIVFALYLMKGDGGRPAYQVYINFVQLSETGAAGKKSKKGAKSGITFSDTTITRPNLRVESNRSKMTVNSSIYLMEQTGSISASRGYYEIRFKRDVKGHPGGDEKLIRRPLLGNTYVRLMPLLAIAARNAPLRARYGLETFDQSGNTFRTLIERTGKSGTFTLGEKEMTGAEVKVSSYSQDLGADEDLYYISPGGKILAMTTKGGRRSMSKVAVLTAYEPPRETRALTKDDIDDARAAGQIELAKSAMASGRIVDAASALRLLIDAKPKHADLPVLKRRLQEMINVKLSNTNLEKDKSAVRDLYLAQKKLDPKHANFDKLYRARVAFIMSKNK